MANLLTSMVDKITIDLGDTFVITEMTDGRITADARVGDRRTR